MIVFCFFFSCCWVCTCDVRWVTRTRRVWCSNWSHQFDLCWPSSVSSALLSASIYSAAFLRVFTFETRFPRAATVGTSWRNFWNASFTALTRLRSRALRFSILGFFAPKCMQWSYFFQIFTFSHLLLIFCSKHFLLFANICSPLRALHSTEIANLSTQFAKRSHQTLNLGTTRTILTLWTVLANNKTETDRHPYHELKNTHKTIKNKRCFLAIIIILLII